MTVHFPYTVHVRKVERTEISWDEWRRSCKAALKKNVIKKCPNSDKWMCGKETRWKEGNMFFGNGRQMAALQTTPCDGRKNNNFAPSDSEEMQQFQFSRKQKKLWIVKTNSWKEKRKNMVWWNEGGNGERVEPRKTKMTGSFRMSDAKYRR